MQENWPLGPIDIPDIMAGLTPERPFVVPLLSVDPPVWNEEEVDKIIDDAEKGRIYNFYRGQNFDPNVLISDDDGDSWRYAGQLRLFLVLHRGYKARKGPLVLSCSDVRPAVAQGVRRRRAGYVKQL